MSSAFLCWTSLVSSSCFCHLHVVLKTQTIQSAIQHMLVYLSCLW